MNALIECGPSTKNEIKRYLLSQDRKTDYKAVHTAFEGLIRRDLVNLVPNIKKIKYGQTYGQYWLTRRGIATMITYGTVDQTEKIVRTAQKIGTDKDTADALLSMKRTLTPDTLKLMLKSFDGEKIQSIPLPLTEDESKDFLNDMLKNPRYGALTRKELKYARNSIDELLEGKKCQE